MEIWKSIPWAPTYEVSNTGQVRNGEKLLSLRNVTYSRNYKAVRLSGKECYVHRLVVEVFSGMPIPVGFVVNHLDKNPSNNNIDNLEICTPKQNAIHAAAPEWYRKQIRIPFISDSITVS